MGQNKNVKDLNMPIYTVYMHINKVNGKKYVGISSTSMSKRWGHGYGYKNKGGNSHFYNAIQKYGWENFHHVVLRTNLYREQAYIMEKEYIRRYRLQDAAFGYNKSDGGECGAKGVKQSKEIRQKRSEHMKTLWKDPYYAAKMYTSRIGLTHTEETKAKLSKMRIGERNPFYGKTHSPEFKQKQRERMLGKPMPNDVKQLLINARSKPVRCCELDKQFKSATDAASYVNGDVSAIAKVCRGTQKTAYGYHWEYINTVGGDNK